MADGIFMDRISGGLANRMSVGRALQCRLSRNYRIVTDQRKGQSLFAALRDTRRTPFRAVYPTQFHHDCTNKKKPICELHYFERKRVALFRVRRIGLTGGTFKPIGGSQAPRRCLSSEAAAR
jgi:hypothetical protein